MHTYIHTLCIYVYMYTYRSMQEELKVIAEAEKILKETTGEAEKGTYSFVQTSMSRRSTSKAMCYMFIYLHKEYTLYNHVYIYIYRERERDNLYYIYIYREREMYTYIHTACYIIVYYIRWAT